MTAQLGLYLGWAIILVIAYTVTDIAAVVGGGQPFGVLCEQVLGRRAGLALFGLTIVAQFFVGEGCTITATRVVFAFARDGALPGSSVWSKVDRRTRTPVYATWGVLLVAALLGLLSFAGPVAIGAVFSIGTSVPVICWGPTMEGVGREGPKYLLAIDRSTITWMIFEG